MPSVIFSYPNRIIIDGKNYGPGGISYYASIFGHFVKCAILDNSTEVNESTKIYRMKNIFKDLLDLGGHINTREEKQLIYKNKCSTRSPYYGTPIKGEYKGYIVNVEKVMFCLKMFTRKRPSSG